MKFNYSVFLFVSAILARPQSQEDYADNECYTKFDCKINDITGKMKTDTNFLQCVKFNGDDQAMQRCIYKVAGLRDDQVNLLFNLKNISYKCEPNPWLQFNQCTATCNSNKSCVETCADSRSEKSTECLANHLNVKDFDAKKSVQCTKQCTQDTLSEIMDCDMKCKEPIYKKLEGSAKDSKPTSGTNASSTSPSSGISSLSTGLFSTITVPILLSLVL